MAYRDFYTKTPLVRMVKGELLIPLESGREITSLLNE